MAIEIATAFVQIVPSMKGVGKAIESAFGSASETAGNTAGIKAGNGFAGGFGAKLGVITGIAQSVAGKAIEAFMGLSGEITSASDSAQKFASTLNFAGVSEQQIKRLTASTQDYADKTVYDLNDIRNTTAQLAANGVPNYDKLAEAAGNLNAVAGGSADTFKSVAMVLTQTAGQGKLTTENWNQLSDAIPGASGKIQQALKEAGAYTGNFRDAMADGQITAQEFNDAIMSLGFTDAAVEAATSASTIEGATGNLEAAFVKLGASVLDSVKPAITGGMSWIADGVTNAVPVVQAGIEGLIGWFQRLYSNWRKRRDHRVQIRVGHHQGRDHGRRQHGHRLGAHDPSRRSRRRHQTRRRHAQLVHPARQGTRAHHHRHRHRVRRSQRAIRRSTAVYRRSPEP